MSLTITYSRIRRTYVVDEFQIQSIDILPVKLQDLAKTTKNDTELSSLVTKLQKDTILTAKQAFNINPFEFSLQKGVIMRGHRVVIPSKLRHRILQELHSGHFGVVKIKNLARGYCWWSGIDTDRKPYKKLS